jgi:two-component system, CitB family, sensor kinase
MKLSNKITLLVSILIFVIVLLISLVTFDEWITTISLQMGNGALDLAKSVALSDVVKDNIILENGNIKTQRYIEYLRLDTRAQYIYVINKEGLLFSTPYSDDLKTRYENSLYYETVTKNKSHVTDNNFIIGVIEAYTPIYYEGSYAGGVVVGMSNGRMLQELNLSMIKLVLLSIFAIAISILSAFILANNIKKSLFGLEPNEIAVLHGQNELVMENLAEGIVAFDQSGKMILINNSAKALLNLDDSYIGKNINSFDFSDWCNEAIKTKQSILFKELKIDTGKTLLSNYYIMNNENKYVGLVVTLEDLTYAKQRAEEITGIKQLNYSLRAQNHEFLNKLHTISGLVQLNKPDKALEYINVIAQQRQEIMSIITHKIKSPAIAGLLLVKYNLAVEKKIAVEFDDECFLADIFDTAEEEKICSVVGNILDNSIEEISGKINGKISIYIFSDEEKLTMEFCDNGDGIPKKILTNIFARGYSDKGEGRGYGLWLVKKIVDEFKGEIKVVDENGTRIFITLPL